MARSSVLFEDKRGTVPPKKFISRHYGIQKNSVHNLVQNSVKDPLQGYFSEISPEWPGQAFSLKIKEVLYHQRSSYQDIMVFKSETYGNVLVLDGVIQCTERDEFAYQEMASHLPLFSHPSPKNVLIVGGGDGGVVREVDKHPEVEAIHLCEIDEKVMEVSKEYIPSMAIGFKSPKLTVHVEDGAKFMEKNKEEFDVIITDSSDPIGPAVPLFEKPYYEKIFSALKPNGILCCQGECFWLDGDLIRGCISSLKSIFPVVEYSYINIPSYPCGQIGFFMASKSKTISLRKPVRTLSEEQIEKWNLKYYNPEVHEASFTVPQFVKKKILQ